MTFVLNSLPPHFIVKLPVELNVGKLGHQKDEIFSTVKIEYIEVRYQNIKISFVLLVCVIVRFKNTL